MLSAHAGKIRGLVTIVLTVSALTSPVISAKTTNRPFEEPPKFQTHHTEDPSIRLAQLYSEHKQAISQKKRVNVNDPAVLETLRNKGKQQAAVAAILLAQYHAQQKKWNLVDSLVAEAIQLQPNHVGYLMAATQFAFVQKHYGQAEKFLTRAIQLIQQQPDYNLQQLLNLKDNLAVIYMSTGHYQAAERVLQQTLQARYQLLGDNHPDIANNLNQLGTINAFQQKLEQAEEQLSSALTMLQPEEEQNAELIANVKHNLVEIKRTRKRLDEEGSTLQ